MKALRIFAPVLAILFAFLPAVAFGAGPTDGLSGVLTIVGGLIGKLTPIAVAIALLAFFWGLASYILSFNGDDKEKKKGRDMMMYGILALFVMVSVWGLVNILRNTFQLGESDTTPDVPHIIPQ